MFFLMVRGCIAVLYITDPTTILVDRLKKWGYSESSTTDEIYPFIIGMCVCNPTPTTRAIRIRRLSLHLWPRIAFFLYHLITLRPYWPLNYGRRLKHTVLDGLLSSSRDLSIQSWHVRLQSDADDTRNPNPTLKFAFVTAHCVTLVISYCWYLRMQRLLIYD